MKTVFPAGAFPLPFVPAAAPEPAPTSDPVTLADVTGPVSAFPPPLPAAAPEGVDLLSYREAEVAQWLMLGKRDREIAQILSISYRTVQKHVERILDKLGVETRTAAAAHLMARGFTPRPRTES